jgi:hypothetical protein
VPASDYVYVELYQKNRAGIDSIDSPMGRAMVPVVELDGVERWYNLRKMVDCPAPQGEICINFTKLTLPTEPPNKVSASLT